MPRQGVRSRMPLRKPRYPDSRKDQPHPAPPQPAHPAVFPLYSPARETHLPPNMPVSHIPALAVFGLGGPELLIILAVLILLFGATKLPQLAKGLGQSMKEFKKASKDADSTKDDNEPSEADLKAQLAAAKAELAAAKAAKPSDASKPHGNN
ncbi:MAG: hypothetical protein RL376_1104 [Verrucomicrobiota bacterium]